MPEEETNKVEENKEVFSESVLPGRDMAKTELLQQALFKDTGGLMLNSSIENYQEQMTNELSHSMYSEETSK